MNETTKNIDNYLDNHYIHRSNWLRAAVLGANDGILSTASLAIGVAVASDLRDPIVLATLAGLVAGALSMAAGEYVSVSSQTDVEKADIEREKIELKEAPEIEMHLLAEIYEKRGLKKETALIVAKELTEHDALGAHIRDELGLNEISKAKPVQAAFASWCSLYGWWHTTTYCNPLSAIKGYGIFSLRFCTFLSYHFRRIGCKNRWLKYKKSNYPNNVLGNSRNGIDSISWVFIWCKHLNNLKNN
jgi:VIT1/CCC1 family predicted Fe2+/Mn2+ transporter